MPQPYRVHKVEIDDFGSHPYRSFMSGMIGYKPVDSVIGGALSILGALYVFDILWVSGTASSIPVSIVCLMVIGWIFATIVIVIPTTCVFRRSFDNKETRHKYIRDYIRHFDGY